MPSYGWLMAPEAKWLQVATVPSLAMKEAQLNKLPKYAAIMTWPHRLMAEA